MAAASTAGAAVVVVVGAAVVVGADVVAISPGVPLAELLAANGATTNTPIYPGTTICLPAGATIPEPPTTTPPTTAPPTTSGTRVKSPR